MGVAMYDHPGVREPRREAPVVGELMPVDDRDPHASQLDLPRLGGQRSDRRTIHVSPDGDHGGENGQLIEGVRILEIACVEDVRDAPKRFVHAGTQKPMSVGDHADEGLSTFGARRFASAVASLDHRLLFVRYAATADRRP